MADERRDLFQRGLVRVLDLLLVTKNPGGSVEASESHEFGDSELGELRLWRPSRTTGGANRRRGRHGGDRHPGVGRRGGRREDRWDDRQDRREDRRFRR
jgi:hypothetical protein